MGNMDDLSGLLQQARSLWLAGEYQQAAGLYEQAIAAQPDHQSHYWHLGLMLLLMGNEADAQMTWLMAPEAEGDEGLDIASDYATTSANAEASETQAGDAPETSSQDIYSGSTAQSGLQLAQVLLAEGDRQVELGNAQMAWAIRQYLRELNPTDVNNLLRLVQLSISIGSFQPSDLIDLGLLDLLTAELEAASEAQPSGDRPATASTESQAPPLVASPESTQASETAESSQLAIDPDLLLAVVQAIYDKALPDETVFEFTAISAKYLHRFAPTIAILDHLRVLADKLSFIKHHPQLAVRVAEIAVDLEPEDVYSLNYLAQTHSTAHNHAQAIAIARQACELAEQSPGFVLQVIVQYALLKALMVASGYWQEAEATYQKIKTLLHSLFVSNPELSRSDLLNLRSINYFAPYLSDNARENRLLQNQLMQFCQTQTERIIPALIQKYGDRHQQYRQQNQSAQVTKKPLRIGYLSSCMRRHSVGWLARWLFQYHDRDRFELYSYFINYRQIDDKLQSWYAQQSHKAYRGGVDGSDNGIAIAAEIFADEVDILVDLDSITSYIAPEVMSLKPAPIQVSWLGLDAPGIPTIDYFIADDYVLPEYAQEYYSEKIWRLPNTYLAVAGFETAVPTLRRDRLDIPTDAVVFLTAQAGHKRHPATAKLQMQIMQQVPNSYLLIKGVSEEESIQKFFNNLAAEVGVSAERLKFLPMAPSEEQHRADLAIADVVLDTYPYNGATTTMETLWMGIPIVTRVGEQFSARNSYGMMINAGISEGIAWSDREYVDWGVSLGTDEKLRQKIAYQLRVGRHTAPLWNAKQFVADMETAYEQMWQDFVG
jgi:predicted O-linked N-acetylglucosamine transferase (SPINDLY family)